MDINATLLGQMLVFGVLIWVSWKFIWPPLVKAVEDRQKKIAEGLAAAERGQVELQSANGEAQTILNAAREQAKKIVDQAHRREVEIVEEARTTASEEGKRIVDSSRQDAQQEKARARDELRRDVATLAVAGASRLLQREIDPTAHADLIEQLARDIEGASA
jgi:F-type H+-transporting ATPase subunit b